MARKEKMVTRTIEETAATVMAINIDTAEVRNIDLTIPGTFDTTEDILKAAKKQESATVKYVKVVAVDVHTFLYGMPESVFIKYATILPPRKANND